MMIHRFPTGPQRKVWSISWTFGIIHIVDGSFEILHQLRLIVYPIITAFSNHPFGGDCRILKHQQYHLRKDWGLKIPLLVNISMIPAS